MLLTSANLRNAIFLMEAPWQAAKLCLSMSNPAIWQEQIFFVLLKVGFPGTLCNIEVIIFFRMQCLILCSSTCAFQAFWEHSCSNDWSYDIPHFSIALSILVTIFTSIWWWHGCWWPKLPPSNHFSTPWGHTSSCCTEACTCTLHSTTTTNSSPHLSPFSSFSFQTAEKADQTWFYPRYPWS